MPIRSKKDEGLATPGRFLRSAEAARRLGISSKALRVYEAQGLVRAERTAAGWRVYGPEQIARLHRVVALKTFGFPLGRIAELMAGRLPDLPAFLAWHEKGLHLEADRIDRALRLLQAARFRLAKGDYLSSDDLMDLTRETTMTGQQHNALTAAYEAAVAKHLSPTDEVTLAANGYGGMGRLDADWTCPGKVESSPEVKGELDDKAATVYEGV